jgi:hypothetical protein
MKLNFPWEIFEKYLNIQHHKNPSSGNHVIPRGGTDKMKLMVTFHNFAYVPNKTLETLTHSPHDDRNNTVYATQLTQTNQVIARK